MPAHAPSYDYRIIYCDADTGTKNLADKVRSHLERYTEHPPPSPGQNIAEWEVHSIDDSDFVICIITRELKQSTDLRLAISRAVKKKLKYGYTDRIIPIYYKLSSDEAQQLVQCLSNMEGILVNDDGGSWKGRLDKGFQSSPSVAGLCKYYSEKLSELALATWRHKKHLGFEMKEESVRKHATQTFREGNGKTYTSMTEIACEAEEGERRILVGAGGTGKSMAGLQTTDDWCTGDSESSRKLRDTFDYLFYIPVRCVHSHTHPLETVLCHDLKMFQDELKVRRLLERKCLRMLVIIDEYDELEENERENTILHTIWKGLSEYTRATVLITTRQHCLSKLKQQVPTAGVIWAEGINPISVSGYLKDVAASEGMDEEGQAFLCGELESLEDYQLYKLPLLLALVIFHMINRYKVDKADGAIPQLSFILNLTMKLYLAFRYEKHIESEDYRKENYHGKLDQLSFATHGSLAALTEKCWKCLVDRNDMIEYTHLGRADIDRDEIDHLGIMVNENKNGKFIHKLLSDYLAGFYVLISDQSLINKCKDLFDGQEVSMREGLKQFAVTLMFAVWFDSTILSSVVEFSFCLTLSRGDRVSNDCINLSYPANLTYECNDEIARATFVKSVLAKKLSDLAETPLFTHRAAYASFFNVTEDHDMTNFLERLQQHTKDYDNLSIGDPLSFTYFTKLQLSNVQHVEIHNAALHLLCEMPLCDHHQIKNMDLYVKLRGMHLNTHEFVKLFSAVPFMAAASHVEISACCQVFQGKTTMHLDKMLSLKRLTLPNKVKAACIQNIMKGLGVKLMTPWPKELTESPSQVNDILIEIDCKTGTAKITKSSNTA